MRRGALLLGCAALIGCGGGVQTQAPAAPSTVPATAGVMPTGATGTTTATAAPTASAGDVLRIPLSGAAPDAIELDGATAWVLAGEGGTLMEVDLTTRRELRAIEVGFGATHFALLPGTAVVGRFSNSATGGYCLVVDLETGLLQPVATGELGALGGGEGGVAWALEKADRLVRVDSGTATMTGSTKLDVGENVHVEVRWGGGAAWVGSDDLPLVRVDGNDIDKHETIEVDEGIPFLFEDGLLWGAGPTQLWAVNPTTREITRRISLAGVTEILALDIDGDDAWIAVRKTGRVGTVVHLDLVSAQVVDEVAIDLPAAVRIAPERVWVASYTTNELVGLPR